MRLRLFLCLCKFPGTALEFIRKFLGTALVFIHALALCARQFHEHVERIFQS